MSTRTNRTDRAIAVLAVILWIVAIALASAGCTSRSLSARAAEVVDRYCGRPPEERAILRAVVNRELAPHAIEVRCAGDSAP
jgi:hypothetical protein